MSRYDLKLKAGLLAAASVFWMSGNAGAAQPPGATPAAAPAPPAPGAAPAESGTSRTRQEALDIASQPARDVGASRREIPPVLVKASEDTYGLAGMKSCRQLSGEVTELTKVLGPDFQRGAKYRENRMAKLAQAGGKTVVNSFIPFRGLVREVSGAAPADRKRQAAVEAGYARRGFLRGVYVARNCRPRF